MSGLLGMFVCLIIIGALGAVQESVSGASLGIGIMLVISTLFNMVRDHALTHISNNGLLCTLDYRWTCVLPYRGGDPQWSSSIQNNHPRTICLQPDRYLFKLSHSSDGSANSSWRMGLGSERCWILLRRYQSFVDDLVLV